MGLPDGFELGEGVTGFPAAVVLGAGSTGAAIGGGGGGWLRAALCPPHAESSSIAVAIKISEARVERAFPASAALLTSCFEGARLEPRQKRRPFILVITREREGGRRSDRPSATEGSAFLELRPRLSFNGRSTEPRALFSPREDCSTSASTPQFSASSAGFRVPSVRRPGSASRWRCAAHCSNARESPAPVRR